MARALFLSLLLLLPAAVSAQQQAGNSFKVKVRGIERQQGQVFVALCRPEQYLSRHCSYSGKAKADAEEVTVDINNVSAGRYAVMVFQDVDGDFDLKRNRIGMPLEPVGFGNDAPIRMGPPSFKDASVHVQAKGEGAADSSTSVRLRYR